MRDGPKLIDDDVPFCSLQDSQVVKEKELIIPTQDGELKYIETKPRRKHGRKERPPEVIPKCKVCEILHRGGYQKVTIEFGVNVPPLLTQPSKAFQCPACMAEAFGWNPPNIIFECNVRN